MNDAPAAANAMTTRRSLMLGLSLFTLGGRALGRPVSRNSVPVPDGRPHAFTLHPDGFRLDGHPFQLRSGEMHPIRIPRSAWPHRIAMAKAMGLNCVSIYVMWNSVETTPGVFDIATDRRDFRHFLDLCAQAGMWVYFRPGPYVCAEWDFGGLPPYLLFGDDIRLRTRDPRFLAPCARYIAAIADALRPHLTENGGPVLMMQVENEYGSFGADRGYQAWVRAQWVQHGIGGPFATADGLPQLREHRIALPETAIGLDGETTIAGVRALDASGPAWLSEVYPGWLTHWGDENLANVDFGPDFTKILANDVSFSLYVLHGGTNFGFGAGANAKNDGSIFQPVVTSYDYGAPVDEAGRPTPAYHRLRGLLTQARGLTPPAVPVAPALFGFAPVIARRGGALRDLLPAPVATQDLVSMERGLHQGQGLALYRVTIPPGMGGALVLPPVHDDARLFLDDSDLGTLSRLEPTATPLTIPLADHPRRLDILVDTFGHIGYGQALGDRKGLDGHATLGNKPLTGWHLYGLPLDDAHVARLDALPESRDPCGALFSAWFDLPANADRSGGTYLDLSAWDKGFVWINGHNLGRFWHRGPQQRLFCPAEFLRPTANRVLILDTRRTAPAAISGVTALAAGR